MSLPGFTAVVSLHSTLGGYMAVNMSEERYAQSHEEVIPQDGWEIHGNYCGPGHHHWDKNPKDDIDKVCKEHDECYRDAGYYLPCHCDRALLDNMPAAIARTPDLGAKAAGSVVLGYFLVAPCTGCARKKAIIPKLVCGWERTTTWWMPYAYKCRFTLESRCVAGAGWGRGGRCDCP